MSASSIGLFFFFQAEDGIRDDLVTGVQTCALPIYYKYSALFDSTSRGNIGPIAETLLTETGAAQTIFCPAYIDRTVTVYQGHLFVGKTPLAESFKRYDPVTPAETSDHVATLSSQTP